VFDPFGSILDVSIKESSVDQRANRQSGYGFVHFTTDAAGISAAFQAVSAVDNGTFEGVTYNVELSKNLLKQFNEMKRNGELGGSISPPPAAMSAQHSPSVHPHHRRTASDSSMSSMGSHGSHGHGQGHGGPGPRGGMPGPNYGGPSGPHGAPRWASNSPYPDVSRGYGMPMPTLSPVMGHFPPAHSPYPAPQAQRGGGGQHVRSHSGYLNQPQPQSSPTGMGPAAHNMMYNSNMTYNNAYAPPYGPQHGAPLDAAPGMLGSLHLPVSGQAQGPYGQYRIGGAHVAPPPMPHALHQQPHAGSGRHLPPAHSPYPDMSFHSGAEAGPINKTASGTSGTSGDANALGSSSSGSAGSPRFVKTHPGRPLSNLPAALQLGEGLHHTPARNLATVGVPNTNPPTPVGAAVNGPHGLTANPAMDRGDMFPPSRGHSVSPVPGRSPQNAVHPAATASPAHTALTANSSFISSHTSLSHSGYARSLTESIDEESLYGASSHSVAAYSPYRVASPISLHDQSFDSGLSLTGTGARPPPLNLSGLGMHSAYNASNPPSHGGSSANSVCGSSVHGGYNTSASTSPIPTVRGGLTERLQSMKQAGTGISGQYITWDHEFGPLSSRADLGSKPPTPAANRAVGSATHASQLGRHGIPYLSAGGTNAVESTPTPHQVASKAPMPPSGGHGHHGLSLSPKAGAMAGVPALPLAHPQGITASLPPASGTARSSLNSRSSSHSSASFKSGGMTSPPSNSHSSGTEPSPTSLACPRTHSLIGASVYCSQWRLPAAARPTAR
jgi:hypothetical protein